MGDLDLFYPEDRAYAQRLRAAGVTVEEVIVPGMFHGGDAYQSVPTMKEIRAGQNAAIARALR